MQAWRVARFGAVLFGVCVLALGLSASALAAGSSITLRGPHVNQFGTPFQYTASGATHGKANYIYGWEAPFSTACASTYKAESKRGGLAVFLSKSLAKNASFSIVVQFFARNTEQHRFCAYVVNRATGKTFAHAATSWKNVAAGSSPNGSSSGSLKPTSVGEGQCQAKRFPDESAYAQIAVSATNCTVAESVGYGADAAKGGSYSRVGFSCSGAAEGAGSTWAAAWTGTYYVYSCSSGAAQVAFNWGTNYAYVPASSLPTISPSG
jgi:hypothetical protein